MPEIPNDKRCKRSDGKGWRCRLPVIEGKGYCETHYQQGIRRQRRQPVPDRLKLERSRRTQTLSKLEPQIDGGASDALPKKSKRMKGDDSVSTPANKPNAPALIGSKVNESRSNAAAKGQVIHDLEEDRINCDPEKKSSFFNGEKKFDFDKSQLLHMIQLLLPVLEKMNQEKIIELDIEAKNKGISHDELQIKLATNPQKKICSFCKACIPDVHRSCIKCPYTLCIVCCTEFRDGYIHSIVENMIRSKMITSENVRNISWRFCSNGSIKCPPKYLGGCEGGLLHLTSFYPFNFTKDLQESAAEIISNSKFEKLIVSPDSSSCSLCKENLKTGLCFYTKQEFEDKNLEHFMKHWGNGQVVVIRDMFQSQPDLNWDFGFMLCVYLAKSAESRNKITTRLSKSAYDWCEVEFGRKQIFKGGVTYGNVWNEFLKFKLRFSLHFLEDHFPDHYNAVIQSLPVKEYMNPLTGFMNLGAYAPSRTKNAALGSYVSISYGGLQNPMDADHFSNLSLHAYDVVNVLVHATNRPISERALNEVKILMSKYNSQNNLKSSKKIANRNALEEMFASSAGLDDTRHADVDTKKRDVVILSDDSESESDDEDSSLVEDSCGAHWDIFRREDVPVLLEYLRKYSHKLNRSYGSPEKVVHPLFDEVFYLDDDHKTRLKEEFNVKAWSFKQEIGEVVIIPAGCSYQIRKVKSCVNVVYKFMSPESATEGIKVGDDVRLLPVNHRAKRNTTDVKKMVINGMRAAIEGIREVLISQP